MNAPKLGLVLVVLGLGCGDDLGALEAFDALGEPDLALAERFDWRFAPPDEPGRHHVGAMTFPAIMTGGRSTTVQVFYPTTSPADCPTDYTVSAPPGSYAVPSPLCAAIGGPVASGDWPMIVYDHGGGLLGGDFQRLSQLPLHEALASHGLIVVVAPHSGDAVIRVHDIRLLIDEMLARDADPASPFYRRIAADRIGVSGFSAGGTAAFNLAAGHTPLDLLPDPRIRAAVFYEPGQPGLSYADAATMTVPYMIMGGTQFVSGVLAPDLFDASTEAEPRIWVESQDAVHFNHFTGLCGIVEAAREDALLANPAIAEPLTTLTPSVPEAAAAYGQWNIGQAQYPIVGPGFAGGRNVCDRVGVDSAILSTDTDGDGFTDAPPLYLSDLPYVVTRPPSADVMVPVVTLYTVAYWRVFLAGDLRYVPYLLPYYAERHDLPTHIEIAL